MEISTTHLLLGMLVLMATQIDGAKEKREARELAPGGVVVGPPTRIPEGPPPFHPCDGRRCGNGGTCKKFCWVLPGKPVSRSKKKAIINSVSSQQCPTNCRCCGEHVTKPPPVKCDGSRCGDGGVCRSNVCSVNYGVEILGKCRGDCRCCKEPIIQKTDCVFNGRIYNTGERIEGVCVDITCKDGQWVSRGYRDKCCERCHVYNDPHFMSFDGLYYDFNGKCNYSITQYGTSQFPPYAVYGDFAYVSKWLSRVDETTFKDNTNTVIKMTHADKELVKVNNEDFTVTTLIQRVMSGTVPHPVLAWRVGDCILFLGTQRLLVEHCWSNYDRYRSLYVYAHPALTDDLYGLCGHFNYYAQDDLTHRDGTITPPTYFPNSFGNSWKTNAQNKDCRSVPQLADQKSRGPNEDDPCLGDDLEPFLEECREILSSVNYEEHYATPEQLEIHIMFCARELCALENDGSDMNRDEYLSAVQEMLQQTLMRDVMTTPGAKPPKPELCKACGGDCGRGGTCRSCSCQDDEEKIQGECNLSDCVCCKKKRGSK